MKLFLLIALGLLALSGCVGTKYRVPGEPVSDFVHLLVKGGWGDQVDIWIYSDDCYSVVQFDAGSRKLRNSQNGRQPGLYRSLIRAMDSQGLWTMTTDSLHRDVLRAAKRQGSSLPDVTDMNTDILAVRSSGRTMKAEFYAIEYTLEKVPEAKSLRTFYELLQKIRKGVQVKPGAPASF